MSNRSMIAAEPDFELLIATQRAARRLLTSIAAALAAGTVAVLVVEWRLLGLTFVPLIVSALLGMIVTLMACSEMVDRTERCRALRAMREAWHAAGSEPAGEATRRCLASLIRSIYGPAACAARPANSAYPLGTAIPDLQRAA